MMSTHLTLCISRKCLGQDLLKKVKVKTNLCLKISELNPTKPVFSAVPINMELLGVVITGLSSGSSVSFSVYSPQHISH